LDIDVMNLYFNFTAKENYGWVQKFVGYFPLEIYNNDKFAG